MFSQLATRLASIRLDASLALLLSICLADPRIYPRLDQRRSSTVESGHHWVSKFV